MAIGRHAPAAFCRSRRCYPASRPAVVDCRLSLLFGSVRARPFLFPFSLIAAVQVFEGFTALAPSHRFVLAHVFSAFFPSFPCCVPFICPCFRSSRFVLLSLYAPVFQFFFVVLQYVLFCLATGFQPAAAGLVPLVAGSPLVSLYRLILMSLLFHCPPGGVSLEFSGRYCRRNAKEKTHEGRK